ncbi:unnamed protein product [Phytophthora fragariaefolia]|uniref:Unnamed protein product n=1 Tax=Phytophthora fragariaefolia TaxID=1490495 RepID=A0A9W6Y8Q4_9STRA|nr:unnamed protein product [Phytophthora fragariaefolia]
MVSHHWWRHDGPPGVGSEYQKPVLYSPHRFLYHPTEALDALMVGDTLLDAAAAGDLDRVKVAVHQNASVDTGNALRWAAKEGRLNVVRYLVEEGADVGAQDYSGDTALMKAAEAGHTKVVRYFTEKCKSDVNSSNTVGCTALMWAARSGQVEVVRYLTGVRDVVLDAKDTWEFTALMKAGKIGYADIVRCLAEAGASVNDTDALGHTALMIASGSGHLEVVRYLAEDCGAVVNSRNKRGETALRLAAASGYYDIVQYLTPLFPLPTTDDSREVGALAGTLFETESIDFSTDNEVGAKMVESLNLGAVANQVAVMQTLLAGMQDVSESDEFTRLLSQYVSLWHQLEQTLAYVDATDNDEYCAVFCSFAAEAKTATLNLSQMNAPAVSTEATLCYKALQGKVNVFADAIGVKEVADLMWAAKTGRVDRIRGLIKSGLDVNTQAEDGRTMLMIAAENGSIEMVRYLVQHGANMTTVDNVGNTVLMVAAEKGHVEVCQYLAELPGGNVNEENAFGYTALIRAAANGHASVVESLAGNYSANVNAASKDGYSALLMATLSGATDIVRYLTEEHGANINATSIDGDSALMQAAAGGHTDAFTYLAEECGLDVNVKNNDGDTPLMRAAANGKLTIVRYLTEHGVDINAKNKRGYTALMKASRNGHADVVQCLLEQYGIDVISKNQRGETTLRLAADRGHEEICRLLTPFLPPVCHNDIAQDEFSNRLASLLISPSEVELVRFYKNENIGAEYRAKWLDADAVVKLFIPDGSHTSFWNEICLWQQLRHPNVMKMYGACDVDPNLRFVVCEYASNGSLIEHVQLALEAPPNIWKLLHEAALGLEYLHERGIIHGNLRCSNILIGSDGLAKLSNFGLSGPAKRPNNESSDVVGSKRWQSPEVLGGKIPSILSDIYSLGMCILEAMTKEKPWSCQKEHNMVKYKIRWAPEVNAYSFSQPDCPPGDTRNIVWQMCCQDPDQRPSLSSVVDHLAQLAIAEDANVSYEPEIVARDMELINVEQLWLNTKEVMKRCGDEQNNRPYEDLKMLRKLLQDSIQVPNLLEEFHTLLKDFFRMITMPPQQAVMLQFSVSQSRDVFSMGTLQSRIELVLMSIQKPLNEGGERNLRWQLQRNEQTDSFMSKLHDTSALLDYLKTTEERAAFLTVLASEMDAAKPNYTPEQLKVMRSAYSAIASSIESDKLSKIIPEWFIPRYELVVDEWRCLGSGGFGCVYQAKWLDSEVVAKLLGSQAEIFTSENQTSQSNLSELLDLSSTKSLMGSAEHAEAAAIFRHEVDVWFRFNHPHVVRLFGACHVGTPFFVCEYATNGTLVSYLQKHPDELWAKLHEAALGVQYLHSRGVVHGDLKGNNVVIGSDMKAKVTDFGLSSIANNEAMPQISGAWHWVAPECLIDENKPSSKRPTFASDIYAFGMCIVEALRVVENAERVKSGKIPQPCLPWGKLDNFIVKYHATKGKLPAQPSSCRDNQWDLVKQMCAFEPEQRIKISTVVDRLAMMATHQKVPKEMSNQKTACEAIATARTQLKDITGRGGPLGAFYASLWDRLEQTYKKTVSLQESECQSDFYYLVADTSTATSMLQNANDSLISLAETTMRYYALSRRLDKLCDAYFISLPKNAKEAEQRESRFAWFLTLFKEG